MPIDMPKTGKNLTSAVRETGVSRHNGGQRRSLLKPLGTIVMWRLRGALIRSPSYRDTLVSGAAVRLILFVDFTMRGIFRCFLHYIHFNYHKNKQISGSLFFNTSNCSKAIPILCLSHVHINMVNFRLPMFSFVCLLVFHVHSEPFQLWQEKETQPCEGIHNTYIYIYIHI